MPNQKALQMNSMEVLVKFAGKTADETMKSISEFSSSSERLSDNSIPRRSKGSRTSGSRTGGHTKLNGSPKSTLNHLQVCSVYTLIDSGG